MSSFQGSSKMLSPSAVQEIVSNPIFWILTYPAPVEESDEAGAGHLDPDYEWFEIELGVTETAEIELFSRHGRTELFDEEGGSSETVQCISVPLYFPYDYIWEIELYQNSWGEAGVTHYLHGPEIVGRFEIARVDGQPEFALTLQWIEVVALAAALRHDKRNIAAGLSDIAPLLFYPLLNVTSNDDGEDIRRVIMDAWRATGALSDDAAQRLGDDAPSGAVQKLSVLEPTSAIYRFLQRTHATE